MTYPHVVIHDASAQTWLMFRQPLQILVAHTLEQVLPILERVEEARSQNLYAVGFVGYEAAAAFDAVLAVKAAAFPLAWFALYEVAETMVWANAGEIPDLHWTPTVTQEQYRQAFDRVKDYIRQGDTYQVNFSLRLTADFAADPWGYFTQLVQAQQGRSQQGQYGAFIETEDWAICCASPELFFRQEGDVIHCRPMKGTVPRGLTWEGDRLLSQWLKSSAKNQAENVMIVDMIRNDLGRIARLGTVTVNSLFEIEQYPTLWQMTSTVQCLTDASLSEVFQALFPCASITGAPKRRTMEIIAELEDSPRKIYTGTIGLVTPERYQFNVAIRTVLIDKRKQIAEYGVGGGIVWDSQAGDEFEECATKAKILTMRSPEFSLLETLLWTQEDDFFLLDLHWERLLKSAAYFGFELERQTWDEKMGAIAQVLKAESTGARSYKLRLLLKASGSLTYEVSPLMSTNEPIRVCLAPWAIDSTDVFLYHKTTHRLIYEQVQQACPGFDDVILWNEQGELTESCIGNLVVELDGRWYTPPVECGLLAGTYRQWLLAQGAVEERVIRIKELPNCSRVFLVNSVRQKREAIVHFVT
jgi:para-aminobenzoate synthetase / 4-amino-4-deoxychorismate lyase